MLKTILLKITAGAALFALLFGFAATGGGTGHAQQSGPVIRVSVIGADTGLPLHYGRVKVFLSNNLTQPIDNWDIAANPRLSTISLSPGDYVLQFEPPQSRADGMYANWYYNEKDDWNSADRITIGTESKVITAVLKTLPSIKGFVLGRDTLNPLDDVNAVRVETRTYKDVLVDETVAEKNGRFSTVRLSPGVYTLIATPNSYPTTLRYVRTVYSRTITVTNSAESVQVLMDNQPKISGTITDTATGLPIENICMAAKNGEVTYSSAYDYLGQCSDSQGHYSLIMPSGSYKLTYFSRTPATPYFTTTLSTSFTVTEPNSNLIINTSVQKGGLITATIKDALKKTNSRARFTLYNADTGQPIVLPAQQFSDVFYSGALPTGRYKIKVEPYLYQCSKLSSCPDPYISSFFNDKATLQEADVIEITSAEAKNIGTIFMYAVPPWLKQKLYLPLVNR